MPNKNNTPSNVEGEIIMSKVCLVCDGLGYLGADDEFCMTCMGYGDIATSTNVVRVNKMATCVNCGQSETNCKCGGF